jgi:hypothetical protein
VNASLEASLAVFEEVLDGMRATVASLDAAALDWAPLEADANSIAAMVAHVCGSIDSWLARALVEELARDRDAEFRTRADAANLAARIECCRVDTRPSAGCADCDRSGDGAPCPSTVAQPGYDRHGRLVRGARGRARGRALGPDPAHPPTLVRPRLTSRGYNARRFA